MMPEIVRDLPLVDDDELIDVFQFLADNHKMIVEPSGLLTAAAAAHLPAEGKRVMCILSGGKQIPESLILYIRYRPFVL